MCVMYFYLVKCRKGKKYLVLSVIFFFWFGKIWKWNKVFMYYDVFLMDRICMCMLDEYLVNDLFILVGRNCYN